MAADSLGKILAKKMPLIFKETAPKASNLYSGVAATAFVGAVAFGGMAVKTGVGGVVGVMNANATGPAQYVGNIPDFAYDAQGQVDRRTGDKTLGATGDLVFGLNASKHGGR